MHGLGEQTDMGLQDILMHAAENIDYYRTIFTKHKMQTDILSLSDFPILTRQTIQREHDRFLYGQYQHYPHIGRLLLKRSFGSSGIPLEIYWDNQDDVYSETFLWTYRKEHFGITADEKCCVFRTAEYAGNKIMDYIPKRFSKDGKTLSFSMWDLSPKRLQVCIKNILMFDPVWMIVPPSIALMLAKIMAKNGQSFSPDLRYIELHGEMLDAQTENIIRNVFHVQTANVYATQTAGAIAASCAQGHLHVFSENVVIEVIRNKEPIMDEEGDICITSLRNTAMPLIRLKTGDRGILQNKSCSCGQSAPVLHLIQGRNCDFITTASGEKISAYILRSLTEYINEEVSRCLEYIRFRQNSCNDIDVFLSVKPAFSGWEGEVISIFRKKILDSELRHMQWNFISINSHVPDETETDRYPFFKLREGAEQ